MCKHFLPPKPAPLTFKKPLFEFVPLYFTRLQFGSAMSASAWAEAQHRQTGESAVQIQLQDATRTLHIVQRGGNTI